MSSLLLLLLLALAVRCVLLQRLAQRHALLGRSPAAWWTVELRRRACMCSLPDDLQAFPQPREFRLRVWRLGGLPLWSRSASVALPLQCDAVIGQLPADAYDHLFDPAWRLANAAVPAAWPVTRKAADRRLPA